MTFQNGTFRDRNGRRFIPLGMFACYFRTEYVGEELEADSQHGGNLIEFQHATKSVWQRLFRFLAEEDGCTAIRMFPRGDSGGSAWEGLDIGGRVNRPLLNKIKAFLKEAEPWGIKLQLCLFTEPECSFYCEPYTRTYWGTRLWTKEEVKTASPAHKRFLENPGDLVSYEKFFSDPDVRECCHRFLDELIPELVGFDSLFAVELFNESGWASPHAVPMNTFRWEDTPDYLDWHRDMTGHIRSLAPALPVCISNPGVSLLGHDPIQWSREIRPDFFSMHNYPDICGSVPGMDYASITDAGLQYASAIVPVMMGEWEALQLRRAETDDKAALLTRLSRDTVWMTLLSGAPGCISWLARGYGQYHAVREIFRETDGYELVPCPPLTVNIREAQAWFENLWKKGERECRYPSWRWCPDCSATDGMHRFCVKSESLYYKQILSAERWSLETGVPFRFSTEEGIPLTELKKEDFLKISPPVSEVPGYRRKTLSADGGTVRIVYLANCGGSWSCTKEDGAGGTAELYSLRRPVPVSVEISGLPLDCRVRLYDLDTRTRTELDPSVPAALGVTDHDFVLLIEKR